MKKRATHFRGRFNKLAGYTILTKCGCLIYTTTPITNRWERVTCGRCLRMRKFEQGKIRVVHVEVE